MTKKLQNRIKIQIYMSMIRPIITFGRKVQMMEIVGAELNEQMGEESTERNIQ